MTAWPPRPPPWPREMSVSTASTTLTCPEYPLDRGLVTEAVAILLRAAAQRVQPGRGIRVTLRANRNALMFALKAPGEGVSDAQREALFGGEPKPGTLARARQCIKAHGGVVWANGIAGLGITYYFTLPTRPPV